jgi:hypothetical protein
LLFVAGLCLARPAGAVILYGTGDPTVNTSAPTGPLLDSGWQYEGQFSAFLGTPIAPNYFITAAHLGGASLVGNTPFVYQGTTYTTTAAYTDPNTDLCIYQVSGVFPSYAPLYTNPGGEVGQGLVVFGRGTQRGNPVTLPNGQVGGWYWGAGDSVQRWGQNTVNSIVQDPQAGTLLYATFSASGGPNEATLSGGDSGGGVFIKGANGVWDLAGVNYAVDGPFYTDDQGSNPFNGAMFDTTGLYEFDGTNYVNATNPSGFYASEIAADLTFIDSVIPEPSSGALLALGTGIGAVAGTWRHRRRRR